MRLGVPDPDRLRAVLPALLPPAAIVCAWLFVMSAEPEIASAGDAPEPVRVEVRIDIPERARAPRGVEQAAEARAQILRKRFDFESPFYDPERGKAEAERPGEGAEVPLGVELSALMNTPRGAIAIMNGRPHRVGDRIADLATVAGIDVEARTVTLELDGGGSLSLTLRTPTVTRSD